MELEGRVALISGGARGQGASHARLLAENGAAVVLLDVLQDDGETTAERLRSEGHRAAFVRGDVRDDASWAAAIGQAESFGSLDILVDNAGIVEIASIHECSDTEWSEVLDTNLGGVFRGTRAAVPAMRKSGGGAIINISSVFGVKGTWGYAAYVASKTAVIGLTKSTAITYAPDGIRANAIAPSAVDTPMLDKELAIFAEDPNFDFNDWLAAQPISRVAQPREVSELVLFLASSRSSYSTGGVFNVDGGQLA